MSNFWRWFVAALIGYAALVEAMAILFELQTH